MLGVKNVNNYVWPWHGARRVYSNRVQKKGGHKGPIRGKLIKASLSTEKNLIKDLPIKLIQVNFTVL
jgi:hypothetical protein